MRQKAKIKIAKKKMSEYQVLADTIIAKAQIAVDDSPDILRQEIQLFKSQIPQKIHNEFLVNCLSLLYRASASCLDLTPYREQLISVLALYERYIVEFPTGEGKTLVITFLACLQALSGKHVHVLTFNDYLAQRDVQNMLPLYQIFDIKAAGIDASMSREEKKQAYLSDIIYLSAKEAAFEFLRDQSVVTKDEMIQGLLEFAILDEVDSILIDEAKTPLVLSGNIPENNNAIQPDKILQTILDLNPSQHFLISENRVQLTDTGITKVESDLKIDNLYAKEYFEVNAWVEAFLTACYILKKGIDYIAEDSSIQILDKYTDRIAPDKQWSDILQLAVEIKENVNISTRFSIINRIDFQHFIMTYGDFTGITGTAADVSLEFEELYRKEVFSVPPHIPSIRNDYPDQFFTDESYKIDALIEHVSEITKTGRPILIVTSSVLESENIFTELSPHIPSAILLNAKNEKEESEIISRAGHLFSVTISTHMAGRGVDIPLDPKQYEKAVELGGLYLISINHFECERIDKQIRGRTGRNGEPGATCFFISITDSLFASLSNKEKAKLTRIWVDADVLKDYKQLDKYIRTLQKKYQNLSFDSKRTLMKYSEIIEESRAKLANKRNTVLLEKRPLYILENINPALKNRVIKLIGIHLYNEYRLQIEAHALIIAWSKYLASAEVLLEEMPVLTNFESNPLLFYNTKMMAYFEDMQDEINQSAISSFIELLDFFQKTGDLSQYHANKFGSSNTKTYIIKESQENTLTQMMQLAGSPFAALGYLAFLIIRKIKQNREVSEE